MLLLYLPHHLLPFYTYSNWPENKISGLLSGLWIYNYITNKFFFFSSFKHLLKHNISNRIHPSFNSISTINTISHQTHPYEQKKSRMWLIRHITNPIPNFIPIPRLKLALFYSHPEITRTKVRPPTLIHRNTNLEKDGNCMKYRNEQIPENRNGKKSGQRVHAVPAQWSM